MPKNKSLSAGGQRNKKKGGFVSKSSLINLYYPITKNWKKYLFEILIVTNN